MVIITASGTDLKNWFLPTTLSGMKAEILKDCEEYLILKPVPPLTYPGNHFYLPKKLSRQLVAPSQRL